MAAKRPPNSTITTPSGFEIEYWDAVGVDGLPQQRRYRVNGEKLVSISTIAGIYDKPALTPAAVKLTESGVIALADAGIPIAGLDQAGLRALMVEHGFHYDSVWQVARDRGDVAHDMLLHLLRDGETPNLATYPDDIRPWIAAGMRWAMHVEPEVLGAEMMVASVEHGFAGRFDLLARLRDGRTARIDYKTVTEWKYRRDGKGEPTDKLLPPYDENLIQLAGYEIAAPESGYDPADCRMIVRLGPDGNYDITESHATEEHFLAALTAYKGRRSLAGPQAVAA